jgi:hypothetical protein
MTNQKYRLISDILKLPETLIRVGLGKHETRHVDREVAGRIKPHGNVECACVVIA